MKLRVGDVYLVGVLIEPTITAVCAKEIALLPRTWPGEGTRTLSAGTAKAPTGPTTRRPKEPR